MLGVKVKPPHKGGGDEPRRIAGIGRFIKVRADQVVVHTGV
jgi:hypothetical protein